MENPLLSVILVHYNTPELINNCINSLYTTNKDFNFEVIVIDNSFNEEFAELMRNKFINLTWETLGYNSGFSRANNEGIRRAKADHILLLNPDSEVNDDFLSNMLEFYLNQPKNIGLLTCRIQSLSDDSLQVGSWSEFPTVSKFIQANPIKILLSRKKGNSKNKYNPHETHYTNHEVSVATGACLLMDKNKIIKDNLFMDEDFFLYSEDVEWSYRIKKAGYFNYFCGDYFIRHVNSASTSQNKNKNYQVLASEMLYFFKTLSWLKFRILIFIIDINYIFDSFLIKRKKDSDLLTKTKVHYKKMKSLIKRIKSNFHKAPSSSSNFLKL